MSLNTYLPNTVIKSADHNADHQGLADGTNDTSANSLGLTRQAHDYPYIVSGLIIPTSANLTAVTSTGIAYVNKSRPTPVATSKTYTASKDTYVDLKDDGTFAYVEVANGATAGMTLTLNSDGTIALRIAKVVTSATAVTSVTVLNADPLGNAIARHRPENMNMFGVGSVLGGVTSSQNPALIQAATVVSNPVSLTVAVTFPSKFPSGLISLVCQEGDTTSLGALQTFNQTASGFSVRTNNNNIIRINYIAIGF